MTKTYKIVFNKRYLKDIKSIPKGDQQKIYQTITELANNPRPDGCKKLQGPKNASLYRVRCGDYRVIYEIRDHVLVILIVAVSHRRDIYRLWTQHI